MSISNPSHLLISRNSPRSPAHPQLAHASSTSRHHHAPSSPLPSPRQNQGHLRPSGSGSVSGSGFLGRWQYSHSADEITSTMRNGDGRENKGSISGDTEENAEDMIIDIHPTFLSDSSMPGRVKVIVGRNEFWCHKEVLWFASPFFQGLLQGNWAETNPITDPALSASYAVDLSPPPSVEVPSSPPTDTDPPSPRYSSNLALPDHADPTTHHENLHDDSSNEELQELVEEKEPTRASMPSSQQFSPRSEIYLDNPEDDPSVADILRELRELPETPNGDRSRAVSGRLEDNNTCSDPSGFEALSSRLSIEPSSSSGIRTNEDDDSPISLSVSSEQTEMQRSDSNISRTRNLTRSRTRSTIRHSFSSGLAVAQNGLRNQKLEAVVELHEESPAAFHDFLFWAYPHLECKVTWTNVENLLALSLKLIVPPLQKSCEHFLMTHASGRPVMALSLAEEHCNAELYREASRFVLDQPTWEHNEMQCISAQTQLKLSNRRNWFLERLLKLGSIDVKKEYICRADCPDPIRCQTQLDEKWRQAYSAVCRYGPPQPSVAFRCLRQLETFPTNPSLVMSHPLCQSAAKTWVMSLFDRMFQPKLVYSNPGTEKYWLWITMT
ncbi:uncharacterized protein L201_006651 [Kwoniella dendrophila CBS 6074]|uniref:BTB domain-containing protein n=1 Tax=Kwoniella dendrophila CBS 6074 TaxID=1295534 RepID=A0AAX4K259_9TREE